MYGSFLVTTTGTGREIAIQSTLNLCNKVGSKKRACIRRVHGQVSEAQNHLILTEKARLISSLIFGLQLNGSQGDVLGMQGLKA